VPYGYKCLDSLVEQVATGSADSLHCTRPPGGGLANQNRRCRGGTWWPSPACRQHPASLAALPRPLPPCTRLHTWCDETLSMYYRGRVEHTCLPVRAGPAGRRGRGQACSPPRAQPAARRTHLRGHTAVRASHWGTPRSCMSRGAGPRVWPAVPAPPGGTSGRIPAPAQFARFLGAVCALPTAAAVAPQPTAVGSARLRGWLGGALARVGVPLPSSGSCPPPMRIFLQVPLILHTFSALPRAAPAGKHGEWSCSSGKQHPLRPLVRSTATGCAWPRAARCFFTARVHSRLSLSGSPTGRLVG
jgi:hypothetical protein